MAGIFGSIVGTILGPVKDLVSEIIVDKDKRAEMSFELARLEAEMTDKVEQRLHEQMVAQIDLNKTEAASGSLFVAGWRPFIGWVGGVGLAAQCIVLPIIAQLGGTAVDIDTELLILTITSMLGIGGLRTFEKVKGVSTDTLADSPAASRNVPKTEPQTIIFAEPQEVVQPIGLGDIPEDAPWTK